jgi:hypothetical protein
MFRYTLLLAALLCFALPALGGDIHYLPDQDATVNGWEMCRDASVKGGGYNAAGDCYTDVCLNYAWTSERGGGSGSYTSPVVAGGVGYYVDCTGAADPDPLCMASDERHKLNANSDIALGMDMLCMGGDGWLPKFPGKNHGLYQVGRCGETAAGVANDCPILRAPYDTFEPRIVQATGNRTIWLEGSDPNGFDDGVRTGVWLLVDSGRDDSDSVDADSVVIPSKQNMVGGGSGTNRCTSPAGTSPDITCSPVTTNREKPATSWGALGEILGTESDPTALCIRSDLPNTGMCEDDPRIRCTSGGSECTGRGLTSSCLGFAKMIESAIDANGGDPVAIDYTRDNIDQEGNNQASNHAGTFWVASVSANACLTDGFDVALVAPGEAANTGAWPFMNEQVGAGVSDSNELRFRGPEGIQSGLAFKGGTIAPAQSPLYGLKAADVPACSTTTDDLIVVINDDITAAQTCDHTAGVLTGGGTYTSECYCTGATPAWSGEDCTGATYGGNRGCWDEPSAITRGLVNNSVVEDILVERLYHGATHPMFDEYTEVPGENFIRRVTVRNSYGRVNDLSSNVLQYLVVENVDAPDHTLISLGFFVTGSRTGPIHLSGVRARNVFALGEGSNVDLFGVTLAGVVARRSIITADSMWGARVQQMRGWGTYGRLMDIGPLNTQVAGPFLMRDVVIRNHQEFDLNWTNGEMDGFIVPHDLKDNASYNAQTFVGPFIFDNVHLETKIAGCFLYSDNDGTPIGFPRRTIIRNSSIVSTDPTAASVRLVCAADNDGGGDETLANSDSMDTIYAAGTMPVIIDSSEGGNMLPNYELMPRSSAEIGDCDDLADGTRVYIYNGHATPCQDTNGVLDTGTTASICECDRSGDNWVLPGTAY